MVVNKDTKKATMTSFKSNNSKIAGRQKSPLTTLKEGKLVSRTKHTSKKIQINLEDEVSFTYLGKSEIGRVKYIGLTAFSTGKWCGIELACGIGKHNGTVNGKTYFVCPENFGVFIPLNKVCKVSTPKLKELSLEDSGNCTDSLEEIGMRITVKSVKSTTENLTLPASVNIDQSGGRTTNSLCSHESLSRSSDSGIESPTRHAFEERPKQPSPVISKRTKGRTSLQTKKLVISSFVAPSPKKAIVKSQKSKAQDQHVQEVIHCKHEDFSFKNQFLLKMAEQENENKTTSGKTQTDISTPITTSESFKGLNIAIENQDVFYNPTDKQPTENNDAHVYEPLKLQPEKCEGLSKIPRRIDSPLSTNSNDNAITDPPLPVKKKTSLIGVVSKLRFHSKPTSTSGSDKDKIITTRKVKKTSLERTSLKNSSDARQIDAHTKGTYNDEPAYVMGNNNAAHKSVQQKQGSTSTANGNVTSSNVIHGDDACSPKERKDSIGVDRKLKENKSKLKNIHIQSNGFVRDSSIRRSRDLLKELEDLSNQLKERNNRIDELEILLKNNEYSRDEEKAKTEIELSHRNEKISELDENLLLARDSLQHSSNGFQALSIVLQHYIKQLGIASLKLLNEKKKNDSVNHTNNELVKTNKDSSEKLHTITNDLDSLKSQCEDLQTEIDNIRSSHRDEIENLIKQHQNDKEKIKLTLEKEKDIEIRKVEEENSKCIDKLKEEHKQEIDQLIKLNENQYQELLLEKQNTVNDLENQHEKKLQEKTSEHGRVIESNKLKHDQEKQQYEVELCNLKDEKHVMEDKLKNVMKELESDTKVQAAISQYKQLPAELESLQAVLDMKNQELKDLRVKCMELERKRSEFYELEGKYNSLSQQNQSLNELLKKKTQIERRISVERDSLMEKFERETRKVSQLSMEKEQLIWRASNPDLRFNTLDEEEEDNSSLSERLSTSLSAAPTKKQSNKYKRYSMNF